MVRDERAATKVSVARTSAKHTTGSAKRTRPSTKGNKSTSQNRYESIVRAALTQNDIPEPSIRIPIEILPTHVQCIQACTTFVEEYISFHSSSSSSISQPVRSWYRRKNPGHVVDSDDDGSDSDNERKVKKITSDSGSSSNPLLERLFRQMEETNSATTDKNNNNNNSASDIHNLKMLQLKRDNTISSWLQSIHLYIRNHQNSNQKKQKEPSDDIAVSVTKHLLQIILSFARTKQPPTGDNTNRDKRSLYISQKRAATYMLYQLLQKSSSSRQHFFGSHTVQNHNSSTKTKQLSSKVVQRGGRHHHHHHQPSNPKLMLLMWMDTMTSFVSRCTTSNTDTTNATSHHSLHDYYGFVALQHESFYLLQSLQQQFHTFYPTLSVAVQRFQQQLVAVNSTTTTCTDANVVPDVTTTTTTTAATLPPPSFPMTELRQLRDIALRDYSRLERRIRLLLQEAYSHLDHFVPRFVDHNVAAATATDRSEGNHTEIENDNDVDSIDWEDGADVDETEITKMDVATDDSTISHLQAVEHTIATIQSGVLYLLEDQMNIDFTAPSLSSETHVAYVDNHKDDPIGGNFHTDDAKKERLQAIVDKLNEIHSKHLSVWIDALTNADHLRPQAESVALSSAYRHMTPNVNLPAIPLVRMLPSEMKQQQQVVEHFKELQNEVYHVLRSSKKLGITVAVPTAITTITDS